MCGGSKPSTPTYTPPPAAPTIIAPMEADEATKNAGDAERKKRLAASGRSDTLYTAGTDLGTASAGRKTLGGE